MGRNHFNTKKTRQIERVTTNVRESGDDDGKVTLGGLPLACPLLKLQEKLLPTENLLGREP